jgi:hypothetical protein
MGFPPRIIVVLSLVQFFFIGAGYLLTCASLHRFERWAVDFPEFHTDAVDWYFSHWPCLTTLSLSVRDYGLWTLSLPIIWCVIWVFRTRNMDDLASVEFPESIAGVVLTVALALAFSLSSFHAFRMAYGAIVS